MILSLYNQKFENELLEKIVTASNETDKKITLYLRSSGGLVSITNAVLDIINTNPQKFKIIGFDFIASSAFVFLLKAKCEKKILPDTIGMFHLSKLTAELDEKNKPFDSYEVANLKRNNLTYPETIEFAKQCGFTPKEIKKLKKNQDVYFQYHRFLEIIETYNNNTK